MGRPFPPPPRPTPRNRKVVQLTASSGVYLALCDDGTVWYLRWNGVDVGRILMEASKSSLLGRLLYPDPPCGCQGTGWLPEDKP